MEDNTKTSMIKSSNLENNQMKELESLVNERHKICYKLKNNITKRIRKLLLVCTKVFQKHYPNGIHLSLL